MHKFLITTTLLLLLFSCGQESSASYDNYASKEAMPTPDQYEELATSLDKDEMATEMKEESMPSTSNNADGEVKSNRKIIYTANARMRVDSLEKSVAYISRLVNQSGGFVSSQRMEDNTYSKSATLVLRLPVKHFTGQVDRLLELGNFVDHQEINSHDVSAEWVDLESRLATKRMVRDRYIDILRNRAKKVEDILAAEEKIRVITEEIEAREGRLRYLQDQVEMSTFTLEVYQTQEVRETPPEYVRHFGHEILDSLGNGLFFIKHLFLGLLSIWPVFLLIPLIVWGWRKWRRS